MLVSEKDGGQYEALNKGFAQTSGEILAYLNSDDIYFPWTLRRVGELFTQFREVEWLSSCNPFGIDKDDLACVLHQIYGFSKAGFFRGENLPLCGWRAIGFIQQESTFWRRSLWEESGKGFDPSLKFAGDFDLWARFFKTADLFGVAIPLAAFRYHPEQKTSTALAKYLEEAKMVFFRSGGRRPNGLLQRIRLFCHYCIPEGARGLLFKAGVLSPAYVLQNEPRERQWSIRLK